jgi:hypothetical protein
MGFEATEPYGRGSQDCRGAVLASHELQFMETPALVGEFLTRAAPAAGLAVVA